MTLWRMPLGRTTFRRMTHYKEWHQAEWHSEECHWAEPHSEEWQRMTPGWMTLWRMPLGRTTFRRMTHNKMTHPRLVSNLMAFNQMPLTRINVKCDSELINKILYSILLSVILTFAVMPNVMAPCILHLFFSHLSWAQCYKTFLSVIYNFS